MIAEAKGPPPIKRPIVTLTSDFGTDSYRIGSMKGTIYEINPHAAVVDITHDVPAHDLLAGAFTIRACYHDFPLHTIHVVVVDPGSGPKRRPILVKTENYYFIGPDNGIFSFIYGCERLVGVWQLTATHYFRKNVQHTFFGRDVYAPTAAHISRVMAADDFGEPIKDFARIPIPKPELDGKQMTGKVLLADRFGNLVTNVEVPELMAFMQKNGLKKIQATIGGKPVGPLARTYGEGQGDVFIVPGASGYLEFAAAQRSAEQLLAAKRGMDFVLQFE